MPTIASNSNTPPATKITSTHTELRLAGTVGIVGVVGVVGLPMPTTGFAGGGRLLAGGAGSAGGFGRTGMFGWPGPLGLVLSGRRSRGGLASVPSSRAPHLLQ